MDRLEIFFSISFEITDFQCVTTVLSLVINHYILNDISVS